MVGITRASKKVRCVFGLPACVCVCTRVTCVCASTFVYVIVYVLVRIAAYYRQNHRKDMGSIRLLWHDLGVAFYRWRTKRRDPVPIWNRSVLFESIALSLLYFASSN